MLSAGLQQILFGSTFYPGATVALDFLAGKYRAPGINNYSADFASIPNLTVTRASTKYAQTSAGVLVQFGSGVAAITDQGLLVEEARTNVLLQSTAITTAPWTTFGSTVTANSGTAPDGTNTATLITPSAQKGGPFQVVSVSGSTTYTFSCWIQWISGNTTNVGLGYFDGTHSTQNPMGSMPAITGTWQRVSYTFTTVAGTASISLQIYDNNAAGFGAFRVWGAQLEQAAFATSYIPTTSASVTRAADVVSIGGLSLPVNGTAYARFLATPGVTASNTAPRVIGAGGADSPKALIYTALNTIGTFNGATTLTAAPTITAGVSTVKAGVSWSAGGRTLTANGIAAVTDANAIGSISTVVLGSDNGSANSLNNYIQTFVLYPRTDSAATLQALTT